jgi:hypothetical protein
MKIIGTLGIALIQLIGMSDNQKTVDKPHFVKTGNEQSYDQSKLHFLDTYKYDFDFLNRIIVHPKQIATGESQCISYSQLISLTEHELAILDIKKLGHLMVGSTGKVYFSFKGIEYEVDDKQVLKTDKQGVSVNLLSSLECSF